MKTKYFIKNKTIPQAIHKLQRLERLLTKVIFEDENDGIKSMLQKSLLKRIAMQKEEIDKWQKEYERLNNPC